MNTTLKLNEQTTEHFFSISSVLVVSFAVDLVEIDLPQGLARDSSERRYGYRRCDRTTYDHSRGLVITRELTRFMIAPGPPSFFPRATFNSLTSLSVSDAMILEVRISLKSGILVSKWELTF